MEPKLLGTLVVVVGTAKNLPNKSRFGKQDPFCTVQIGNTKRKTQPIKRGGQHPEWDEELRFPIHEDVDDMLAGSASKPLPGEPGVVTPQSMASKARKTGPKKGAKVMKVAVWADDIKEPELIGEVTVNFDDVLTKGEVDDWWTLQSKDGKDKYCGEVYMELTFFSNARPPSKKPAQGQSPGRPPVRPGIPTSGSISGMNLYIPPYQQGAQGAPGQPQQQPQRVSQSYPAQGQPQRPPPQQPPPQQQRPPSNSYGNNSFAELGLPPQQQGGRPSSAMNANALAGQMGSMSLGPSHQQRPGASAHAATVSGHGRTQSYGQNQQPYGTPPAQQPQPPQPPPQQAGAGAPWAALLPQNQQGQAPMVQRPVSSNDMYNPNDPRASSVPPRPHSSMHQQPPGPSPPPGHGRTGSVSLAPPPVGSPPVPYGNYQPMPEPPRTSSPAQYGGYQAPQPPQQSSSYQHQQQQQQPFPSQAPQQTPYPPQPQSYNSMPEPGRQASWPQHTPQQPPQQGYQQPPQQGYGSSPNTPQAQPAYAPAAHQATPPHRNSLPGGTVPSTTTGPYVPWHMQTNAQQSPSQHAPAPPAPPQRPGGGYYPSDELYSHPQQPQAPPQPPQQPLPAQHQPPPPSLPQNYGGYTSPPPAAPPAPMAPAFSPPPLHSQPSQSKFQPYAPPRLSSEHAPAPPPRVPSPLPPSGQGGAPAGHTNTDWRSYLHGLGNVGASQPQQQPQPPAQGQSDWNYNTPPPPVPSSIMQHAQAQNAGANGYQQQW